MKKHLLTTLSIFIFVNLLAQTEEPRAYVMDENLNWWNLHINDEAIVFADIAYIRDAPVTKGKLLDSLKNGDRVQILSTGYNPTVLRGFIAPWHKIKYKSNGEMKEGYIWLGLLALGKGTNVSGETFIHGFLRKNKQTEYDNGSYILEIKTLDRFNNVLARAHYPAELNYQSYTENKILNNMGLEGLTSIHRISFLGEACGVSSNYYYFGWNGEQFIPMFDKTNVSDAGIYYYNEQILFPSEHNLENQLIIKDIEEGEVIDEAAEELNYKIKKERKKYNWNGKVISEILEMR